MGQHPRAPENYSVPFVRLCFQFRKRPLHACDTYVPDRAHPQLTSFLRHSLAAGPGPRSCRPVGGPSPAVTGMPSPPHSPGKRHLDAAADAVSRSAADQATAQSRVSKHHGAAFWALIDSWKVSEEAALRLRVELPLKGREVFVDRKPFPYREAR